MANGEDMIILIFNLFSNTTISTLLYDTFFIYIYFPFFNITIVGLEIGMCIHLESMHHQ